MLDVDRPPGRAAPGDLLSASRTGPGQGVPV